MAPVNRTPNQSPSKLKAGGSKVMNDDPKSDSEVSSTFQIELITQLQKQMQEMSVQIAKLSGNKPPTAKIDSPPKTNLMQNIGSGLTFGGIPFGQMKRITADTLIDEELFRQICLMARLSSSTPRITQLTYDGKMAE